jgi:4-hydroxy-3-methylbut-2-en-1-yl diphosphate reductase
VRVLLAESAGFCPGVDQAVRKAKLFSSKHPFVWTDGTLIHNPQMIEKLREWNVRELPENGSDPNPKKGVILIRAHGISPKRKEELKAVGLPIKDGTCPEVAKIAEHIQLNAKENRCIFIFGDPKHAETIGLQGHAGENCTIFPNLEAAQQFAGTDQPSCLVSQSTQSMETYAAVADILGKKCPNLIVLDTICPATKSRQRDVDFLVDSGVDVIIVIGGSHSANTQQLVALAKKRKIPTFLAETVKDLDLALLKKSFKFIGLTGGASTPPWVLREVYETLLQM